MQWPRSPTSRGYRPSPTSWRPALPATSPLGRGTVVAGGRAPRHSVPPPRLWLRHRRAAFFDSVRRAPSTSRCCARGTSIPERPGSPPGAAGRSVLSGVPDRGAGMSAGAGTTHGGQPAAAADTGCAAPSPSQPARSRCTTRWRPSSRSTRSPGSSTCPSRQRCAARVSSTPPRARSAESRRSAGHPRHRPHHRHGPGRGAAAPLPGYGVRTRGHARGARSQLDGRAAGGPAPRLHRCPRRNVTPGLRSEHTALRWWPPRSTPTRGSGARRSWPPRTPPGRCPGGGTGVLPRLASAGRAGPHPATVGARRAWPSCPSAPTTPSCTRSTPLAIPDRRARQLPHRRPDPVAWLGRPHPVAQRSRRRGDRPWSTTLRCG